MHASAQSCLCYSWAHSQSYFSSRGAVLRAMRAILAILTLILPVRPLTQTNNTNKQKQPTTHHLSREQMHKYRHIIRISFASVTFSTDFSSQQDQLYNAHKITKSYIPNYDQCRYVHMYCICVYTTYYVQTTTWTSAASHLSITESTQVRQTCVALSTFSTDCGRLPLASENTVARTSSSSDGLMMPPFSSSPRPCCDQASHWLCLSTRWTVRK